MAPSSPAPPPPSFPSLPTELKLLILSHCHFPSLLSLRQTSSSTLHLIHSYLLHNTPHQWYHNPPKKHIHFAEQEAELERRLEESLYPFALRHNNMEALGWLHGVKVHRILGFTCVEKPEEECRLEVSKSCFINANNEDDIDLGKSIPFESASLFYPPIKAAVPTRMRYRFSYPPCHYDDPNPWSEFSDEVEGYWVPRGYFDYESVDTKFLLCRRTASYITVGDAVAAFEKQLKTLLKWEEKMTINRFHVHVNQGGWLDVVLSVTMRYTPHDYNEYINDDIEDRTSEARYSDTSYNPSITESCVASEYGEEFTGSRMRYSEDDLEEETFEMGPRPIPGDVENKWVVIDEKPYSEMEWYVWGVGLWPHDRGECLRAYEGSQVAGFPSIGSYDWEVT